MLLYLVCFLRSLLGWLMTLEGSLCDICRGGDVSKTTCSVAGVTHCACCRLLQVDYAKILHYVGAGVAFPTSMLFVCLQSALTYRLAKTQWEYCVGHLRLALTLVAFISLVLSILKDCVCTRVWVWGCVCMCVCFFVCVFECVFLNFSLDTDYCDVVGDVRVGLWPCWPQSLRPVWNACTCDHSSLCWWEPSRTFRMELDCGRFWILLWGALRSLVNCWWNKTKVVKKGEY